MLCPQCRKGVPDESFFCLHCGTRLPAVERLAPVNGGGATRAARPAASDPGAPSGAAALSTAGARQAYALSFKALADERLRYRVARWVCDTAPAHALSEVQESLTRGDFATFLALTPEEAEVTRQRIQALGVHPALLRLTPATAAELLTPTPVTPAPASRPRRSMTRKLAAVGIGLAIVFLFGLVLLRMLGGRGF